MMKARRLALLLFLLPLLAWGGTAPHVKRVYMFGFAASFTDSIAYQTDIQALDSTWLEGKSDFLVDRALYSLQLQYFVESQLKNTNSICTVFYNKKYRKLQKTWMKVKKRYQNNEGLTLKQLTKQDFTFLPEEYKPIINEEVSVTAKDKPSEAAKDDKQNKKAKADGKVKKVKKK